MRTLLEDAVQRAISYLDQLGERRVAPAPEAVQNLWALDVPLPIQPS